jgi:hypothetical protein
VFFGSSDYHSSLQATCQSIMSDRPQTGTSQILDAYSLENDRLSHQHAGIRELAVMPTAKMTVQVCESAQAAATMVVFRPAKERPFAERKATSPLI